MLDLIFLVLIFLVFLVFLVSLIAVAYVLNAWDAEMKESSDRLRAEIEAIRRDTASINSEIESLKRKREAHLVKQSKLLKAGSTGAEGLRRCGEGM